MKLRVLERVSVRPEVHAMQLKTCLKAVNITQQGLHGHLRYNRVSFETAIIKNLAIYSNTCLS